MVTSLIGKTIGQYQVVAELGRGQHSVVYKAWQQSLQRYVALKILRHYGEITFQKFQVEARLTAQLIQQGVPNIRQVYEVGQTADGYLFVALEYTEDSLQNVLKRVRERGHRINSMAAARLLQPVAEALDAIHSLGWVHLDVKPQNILILKGGRSMVADLGIAQRRGMQTHACTPLYASPEQAAGDRPVGPWSDIYSLGVVLYEMVTGCPPVRGDQDIVLLNQHLEVLPPSPRKANPRLTHSQERAILKALAKAPKDRYQTAGQLIKAMLRPENVISGVMDIPSAAISITTSWTRRIPRPAWIGGLVVLVLATLALLGWMLWPKLQPGGPAATEAATAPVVVASETVPSTSVPATPLLTAMVTRQATATITPSTTERPTATLAPTSTRVPRPTATRTPKPTETAGPESSTPQATSATP
jgi:serine/threonine protein kinase